MCFGAGVEINLRQLGIQIGTDFDTNSESIYFSLLFLPIFIKEMDVGNLSDCLFAFLHNVEHLLGEPFFQKSLFH